MVASLTSFRVFCAAVALLLASVAVGGTLTPEERVIVIGYGSFTEVPYTKGLTASKAIIAGGGIHDFGNTPIFLVRCGRATHIDVEAALLRGQRDQDPELQPWDIIAIGTAVSHRK
jgi:protein involved in polysaccharide export with SLBB domain